MKEALKSAWFVIIVPLCAVEPERKIATSQAGGWSCTTPPSPPPLSLSSKDLPVNSTLRSLHLPLLPRAPSSWLPERHPLEILKRGGI
jgi:hypothetical protein